MLCLEGRELGSSVPGRGVPCQAGQLCAHLSQGRLSERRQKMKPGDEAEKQGSSCRHVSPYSHLEQTSRDGGMLRGAAGRDLLHSSYRRVHSQKSHHHSRMQDHTALRLRDRLLPRHHGWDTALGLVPSCGHTTLARSPRPLPWWRDQAWQHSSPRLYRTPKGFLSRSHHPKSPKILLTV